MWASIAMRSTASASTSSEEEDELQKACPPTDVTFADNSSMSSSSFSESSSTSWTSFGSNSSSSTATPFPPAVVHIGFNHSDKPLKGRMRLTDYSQKSCDDSRGTFQLSSGNHNSNRSNSSLSLSSLVPFACRSQRGSALSSSSSRLQTLMMRQVTDGSCRFSHVGGRSNMGSYMNPRRGTLLQRKQLIANLERALTRLRVNSTDEASASKKEQGENIIFLYKKTSGRANAVSSMPSLKRTTSTTLEEMLKENRRQNLIDLIEDPLSLSRLNTSSLMDTFHPVSREVSCGRNSISEVQKPLVKTATTKAMDGPSFHEGFRDLDGVQFDTPKIGKKMQATTNKLLPQKHDDVEANALKPKKAKNRFLLISLNKDSEGHPPSQRSLSKRKQAMRRSASAPRNSFSSGSSFSLSIKNKQDLQDKKQSEIAALQALAGGSLSSLNLKKSSFIPDSITVLRRAASDESCLTTQEDPGPQTSKNPKDLPTLRPNLNSHSSIPETASKNQNLSNKKAELPVPHRGKNLQRCNIVRRGSQNGVTATVPDSSISNLSTSRKSDFQRASSFSSRKSMSLMVQNANLQDDKLGDNCSGDHTTATVGMDTSASSNSANGRLLSSSNHCCHLGPSNSRLTLANAGTSNQSLMKQQSFVAGSQIRILRD